MDWLYIFNFFEFVITTIALGSSTYFVYIIANSTIVQPTSRPFLLLFSISLFFLALTHGFQIFELLIGADAENAIDYTSSMRLYVWSLLHEFAFALHSFSIQMFSLERYITAKQTITQSVRNQVLSITLGVIISILSMCYAQIIHLVDFHVIAITIMNLVDMSALVILIISSQYSIQNYRKTAGIASLEKRFQISDVYIWTQAIIPVACIAFLIHFTFVIVVWLLSTLENSRYYQMTFSHYFENITSVFTICVPFLVVYKHKRIKKTKLLNRSRIGPQNQVRTLDGKTIQMRETIQDHFNFLKNTWK